MAFLSCRRMGAVPVLLSAFQLTGNRTSIVNSNVINDTMYSRIQETGLELEKQSQEITDLRNRVKIETEQKITTFKIAMVATAIVSVIIYAKSKG